MIIKKSNPMNILYDIVKDIDIPVYKWIMNEDENDIPQSYALLRSDVSDSTILYGDGDSKVRTSSCDISVISKGMMTSTRTNHYKNIQKIRNILIQNNIPFTAVDFGYSDALKSSEYTFSINMVYMV